MNTTASQYEAAQRPLTDIIEAVPTAAWKSPSPCEGWTARDVVRHLIRTQRELLTAAAWPLTTSPTSTPTPRRHGDATPSTSSR